MEKPLSEFARNRARPDGYAPQCKVCLTAFNRAYQASNVERHAIKRCTKCGERKSIADFGRKSQTASGLHSWCKACVKFDGDQRAAANRAALDALKRCAGCAQTKPVAEFYKASAQRDGLNSRCKPCVNEYNRAHAELNKEASNRWSRERSRRAWAKRYLGFERVQYEAALARADGRCEICGRLESTKSRNGTVYTLAFDHDHVSGKFRGMLCRPCNTALGCANEDPALLRKLADYLEAGGIQFT
jgi:hypothetical protein